jgi:predicted metal-dependent phosphoesterase TrpH
MIVDFHSHTRESDGALPPAELADMMRKRGVRIFSITDHDTMRAYGQFVAEFATVIPGIEINTTWNDNEVHVLGYRLPMGDDTPLAKVLAENREFRRTRIDRIAAGLTAAGYPLTAADVVAESDGGDALGRPHVAKALIRKGYARDVQSCFDTLLVRGKPGYMPSNYITPARAIDVIRDSGGVPVLAHPGRLKDDAIIGELIDRGLAGLEVFYPTHNASQTAIFRERAVRHGLVMTGGSDFHDIRHNARGVGMDIEDADIKPFLDLVS